MRKDESTPKSLRSLGNVQRDERRLAERKDEEKKIEIFVVLKFAFSLFLHCNKR
jgi:hypothetical protein